MKKIMVVSMAGLLAGSMVMMSSCASAPKKGQETGEAVKKEAAKVVATPTAEVEKATPAPTKTATTATEAVQSTAPAMGSLDVVEIAIAKAVQDHEAVDVADSFTADVGTLFCWNKITGGAEGKTITHRWKKDGEVIADVTLNVSASPWRTHSSKAIMPDWTGKWTVEVLEGDTVIKTKEFVIQ